MSNYFYNKLELDKILAAVSENAYSEMCREKILATKPVFGTKNIRAEIGKTDDAFTLSAKFGTPRFVKIKDIKSSVKRAENGSSLSLRELLDTASVLRVIGSVKSWHSQCENIESTLDYLFLQLIPNRPLLDEIDKVIISEDEISDNASPELMRIRKSINRQSQIIRDELDKLVKSQSKSKYLQDAIVTQRDGRYVVPVKTEYKNEISGLVHDSSSSGQTLFIEPISVVEANNEIRVLKGQEQTEIERIIYALSESVGLFCENLLYGFDAVVELEYYFVKANYGAKIKGITPEILDEPKLELKKARHPLISKETVVPISLNLGYDYNCLIVTGPNTGGKTVAIKTAGLLTLMTMCGLMIPCVSGSAVGTFSNILVDIGDEQSIEQSLSTFSSHMNNIISMMKYANDRSLILLDELGSGTDPIEGAALAVSVLTKFRDIGARVIATTHYQEVKMFAIEADKVENASCEFDVNTLQPTFKLIVGIPGKSNAFSIVKRLGMADEIIEGAKHLVSEENKRFENVVEMLEKSRQEVAKLRESAETEHQKAKTIRLELEKKLEKLEREKDREIEKARTKAMRIIGEVEMNAEKLITELEEMKHEKDKENFSERVRGARGKLNKISDKMYEKANPVSGRKESDYKLPRPLKMYDSVILMDIDKNGTVIKEPDSSGNCLVQVGLIKTKTNIKNLKLVEDEQKTTIKVNNKKVSSYKIVNKTQQNSMELDIRGMASDEGIMEVDKFIDSCLMSGLELITIIHGKGTGVLREKVGQFLKSHKHVKSYRPGVYGEGEAGVTVVELK